MPRQIQASMTVRWLYIVVALVVLIGLGWWLFSTYNTSPDAAPATTSTQGATTQ